MAYTRKALMRKRKDSCNIKRENKKSARCEKTRKSRNCAPSYYKGEKQAPHQLKPRLTRNVVNKTFKTDSELTEFILCEGTFKDKIAAMTLITIKEHDRKALAQLLAVAECLSGCDKSYLAISHAVKIVEYYKDCKSDMLAPAVKEPAKICGAALYPNENTEPFADPRLSSASFCAFVEKTQFVKRLVDVFAKQMLSPFLKKKLCMLIKNMIEADTLAGQMLEVLMEAADLEIDKEIMLIFAYIVKSRNIKLIHILRDKIVQTLLYHKNFKKVKYFVTLSLAINRSEWILEDCDYKVYIAPLINAFLNVLKKVYNDMDNPNVKNKTGCSVISSLLKGLLRFINWQKTVSSLDKNYTALIFKDLGYVVFKLAYNDNTRYSLPALNILEAANETEKINYARVLGDTIRKYIYLNDLSRCEILNKAVNMPAAEVQQKIVHSAYYAPIASMYPLGCMMVSQEASAGFSLKIGYLLLRKALNSEVAEAAEKIVRGEAISIYNIWS